ncbi:MAG: lipopolysaccharide biosynthesis protein [Bacteroidota bacterium]
MTSEEVRQTAQQIGRRTAHGIIWNFLAYGLGRLVVLVTTSILARILSKTEFGLVAVAVVAINYLSVIKDLGLGVALIQKKGDIEEAADTVFTANLFIGLAMSLLVIPLSPWIAAYFKDPAITPVLRWMGVTFLLNALGSVHVNRLMRELDYRRKFIPDMGNSIVKGVVSIAMAFAGYGVWSLVFGQLLGTLASVILVWIILPWRPRLSFNRAIATGLMKFGVTITGDDVLNQIIDNIDYVIVGRMFGLVQLSIYTLGYRLPEMLLIGNLWIMGGVMFPAFSRVQDRPSELRRGFLASIRVVEMIALPVSVGLFIAADPIVRVVFGDQWLEVIPVLRVLAIYGWIYSIGYHVGGVYKAIGRPDIIFKLSLLTLVIILPALLIGARLGGIIGVAFGHLTAILIRRVISLTLATRYVDVSIGDMFDQLKPSFLGVLVMAPAALGALYLTAGVNVFIQLAVVALVGAAAYMAVLWWLERDSLLQMARVIGLSRESAG